jgi:hypothetical protein
VKISIILNSFKSKEKFLLALSYALLISKTFQHEVYLILIDEAVKYADKDLVEKILIQEELKEAIYFQTGVNINYIKNAKELLNYLKNNFKFYSKVCNTSSILHKVSDRIGDNSKISETFELTTIYDVYQTIILSNECIYL